MQTLQKHSRLCDELIRDLSQGLLVHLKKYFIVEAHGRELSASFQHPNLGYQTLLNQLLQSYLYNYDTRYLYRRQSDQIVFDFVNEFLRPLLQQQLLKPVLFSISTNTLDFSGDS